MTTANKLIKVFSWNTPNGVKIPIALEEMDIPYTYIPVNIMEGAQHKPEFLQISPNNKIPAIVDPSPPEEFGPGEVSVFESAAILSFLADYKKPGSKGVPLNYPKDKVRERLVVNEWLCFQIASVGPMLGQFSHFSLHCKENIPYAVERYKNEALRLFGVMDRRLATVPYLAGEMYTIADIAHIGWISMAKSYLKMDLSPFVHLEAWLDKVSKRPAVQKGNNALK